MVKVKRGMRIAIFTDSFLPQIDGVTTTTINVSKELVKRGHKVYIIAPKVGSREIFFYPGIKVIRIPSIPAFFYKGYRFASIFNKSLVDYLKKEKIDLIHLQTPISLGVQAVIISKILKVPLVGTFHTLFMHPQYLEHIHANFKIIEKISWEYAKLYYNRCDLVTCPSEDIRKQLVKWKFKPKLRVISNGIDLHGFDNSKWREVKKKFNPNGKLLLYVGRIAYEKNIFFLLECFNLIVKKSPSTKLLVVGDGPQMNLFKNKIKELNLSRNVIVLGKVPYEKLKKSAIYVACDIFVTASMTETQGITTLEAQANGLVCVGMNAGGTKDLIKKGYNGYLINGGNKKDFSESVLKLLNDNKLYERMKKNSLREVDKHKIENVVKIWEEEYSKLL